MIKTVSEIIARQLCALAELDPDAASEHGTPNWHEMRAQAMQIEIALVNAGYEIMVAE